MMSEQTKDALEAAISAHIADTCDGDLVGAWVVLAECTSLDQLDADESEFFVDARDGQSRFTGDGLLYSALHRD